MQVTCNDLMVVQGVHDCGHVALPEVAMAQLSFLHDIPTCSPSAFAACTALDGQHQD